MTTSTVTPTDVAGAEARFESARLGLEAARTAIRAAEQRFRDAETELTDAERALAAAKVDAATGILPVGTRVRHYGFTDLLGTVAPSTRAGLAVVADGQTEPVQGYQAHEWVPVEETPAEPAPLVDAIVDDYNGFDLQARVEALITSGFALTVNGDRIDTRYGTRIVDVCQNGSLSFRVVARTKPGRSNVVYVKLGARLVVRNA